VELLLKTYLKNYNFVLTQLKNKKPDYIDDWGTKYVAWKDVVDLYATAPMNSKSASMLVINNSLDLTKTLPVTPQGRIMSFKKFPEEDWFFTYNTYSDFNLQYLKIMNSWQSKLHDLSLYFNQLDHFNGFINKIIGYNVTPLHFFSVGFILLVIFLLSFIIKDPYKLLKRNFEARLYIIENFLALRFNKGRDIVFSNKFSGFYTPNKLTYPYYSLMTSRFGAQVGNNIIWSMPFPVEPGLPDSPKKEFVLSLYLGQKPICKAHDYWKPEYLINNLEEEEDVRRARKRAYQIEKQEEYERARRQQGL
jgi:hypothetical protein